jgi:hypothetical protein
MDAVAVAFQMVVVQPFSAVGPGTVRVVGHG